MLRILLILIFIRPFLSSAAYPCADAVYSFLLLGILLLWTAKKGISSGAWRPLAVPLSCYAGAVVLSVFCSGPGGAGAETLYKYVQGIFLVAVAASLAPEDKERLIDALLAAGVIVSLLALYQYLFGFRLLAEFMQKRNMDSPFALDYISRRRSFLPFVTPNALAGYVSMLIPLAFISRRRAWIMAPLSVALVLTGSIGAAGSLAAGLGVFFYCSRSSKKWLLIYAAGLAACLGLIVILRLNIQKEHTQPVFSAVMRLDYWRQTIALALAHPFCGVGIGNFDLAVSRYAHNSYLQLWAETGILGIASFLWLVFAAMKAGLKNLAGHKPRPRTACLIMAALTVFLAHNVIDFTFYLPEVSLIWWLLLGLLLSP